LSFSTAEALYYSIAAFNPNNAFAIDSATGQLTIPNASNPAVFMPSNNVPPQYTMTIGVRDAGVDGPAYWAYVNITVNLTKTYAPPILSPYILFVPELSTNGTAVGTVSASSLDSNSLLSMSYVLTPAQFYPTFPFSIASLPLGPGGNMVGVITVAQGASIGTFSAGPKVC
jgi:hypothetical protein